MQRVQDFWNSIVAGANALWDQLTALFQAGFDLLSSGWAVIVAAAQAVFDALKALAQVLWNGIVSGAQAMWDTITGAFSFGRERDHWLPHACTRLRDQRLERDHR